MDYLINLVKARPIEDDRGLGDLSTNTLNNTWRKGMHKGLLSREGVPSWCGVGNVDPKLVESN